MDKHAASDQVTKSEMSICGAPKTRVTRTVGRALKKLKNPTYSHPIMEKPTFSVVTTAKNEKNKRFLEETFQNWETVKQLFEKKTGKRIEFVIVDAGGNTDFPKLSDSNLIACETYHKYRQGLYLSAKIKYKSWDSPTIGRNLGFSHSRGSIVVFQDIDTQFSSGTDLDFKYVTPKLDKYENYFEVMYKALRSKNIVGAAPSARASDTQKISRRFGTMGENYTVWFSTKIPTIRIHGTPISGPSVPGFSIAVLRDVALRICADQGYLYDPELAVAEDHKFSRILGEYGRISYEKRAGVFTRTINRISPGFDLLKSFLYAFMWIIPYSFPDAWKYRKHTFSI
jgi:glycosyltransferase involved in cell wall biosynthesis